MPNIFKRGAPLLGDEEIDPKARLKAAWGEPHPDNPSKCAAPPFLNTSAKKNKSLREERERKAQQRAEEHRRRPGGLDAFDPVALGRFDWPRIYAEYMAGDTFNEIGKRHGIGYSLLQKYVTEAGWPEERHQHYLRLQQQVRDRLEDLTISETDRMVRTHFSLITQAMQQVMDMLPQVRSPKDAREFAAALDTLIKSQRLAGGVTNYIADPNGKGGKADRELADDLDAALGLLDDEEEAGGQSERISSTEVERADTSLAD